MATRRRSYVHKVYALCLVAGGAVGAAAVAGAAAAALLLATDVAVANYGEGTEDNG